MFWICDIIEKGAEWMTSQGRHERKGFRSFSVSGRVKKPGVVLAPAAPTRLRPYLIDAVERGMQRTLARLAGSTVNGGAAKGDGANGDGGQPPWASARSSASSSSGSRVTSGSASGSE